MQVDATTFKDLNVFAQANKAPHYNLFHLLDNCQTYKGRQILQGLIKHPPRTFPELMEQQETIKFLSQNNLPISQYITNGTVVMIDKFLEDTEAGALPPGKLNMAINGFFQRFLKSQQDSLASFSLVHVADLVKGCFALTAQLDLHNFPKLLQAELQAMVTYLGNPIMLELRELKANASYATMALLTYKTRRYLKKDLVALLHHYSKIDAWHSLAQSGPQQGWNFPELLPAQPSVLEVQHFYHPLLSQPVAYNISLSHQQNFLILTGANMSGKTTFMRALGIITLLAHLGCAIPAKSASISFLEEITTHMQVEDNMHIGESYFMAEVKRIKKTAEKIAADAPRLFLMDELFKGTNVQDAYDCTKAVITGMQNHPHHLFILSTHLYEVAQHFASHPHLQFSYFITEKAEDGSFGFPYLLKKGISDDRIGYTILKQEGVLKLLGKVDQA